MAGYHNFSKSNNAVEAEESGRFPATVLAKMLGVKAGAIRAIMSPCEWHHTSSWFNCTDYYRLEDAEEVMDELKAWKPEAKAERSYKRCTGSYLVWSGTRNHPHAREVEFGPCTVTQKGVWYIVHTKDGDVRKKETTRGFKLFDSKNKWIVLNK